MSELGTLAAPSSLRVLPYASDVEMPRLLVLGIFDDEPQPSEGKAFPVDFIDLPREFGDVVEGRIGGEVCLGVGLGGRVEFGRTRGRDIAQRVHARAKQIGRSHLCWFDTEGINDAALTGLVEGTVLAAQTPDVDRSRRDPRTVDLVVSFDAPERWKVVERALVVAEAQNCARALQNAPSNLMKPSDLADRATALAAELPDLTVQTLDEDELKRRGMGAFGSVADGSHEHAKLIQLRYEPADAGGPLTAWIGKAVTYDSGGLSLKRGPGMAEMKFDMSGGAAVIEAIGAVARLGLPVRILAIAGATENMPGAMATHPGDIVRSLAGTTIEITNTDAEGRLVLADCITHAIACGAERIVDLASLTGAVVDVFDGRYGALFSNDDAWAAAILSAAESSGELVWRMPLHPDYSRRLKSQYADLANHQSDGKAGTILAAEFLHHFAGSVPWAHIDALAWNLDHEPVTVGGAGFGVRLLLDLATNTSSPVASDTHIDTKVTTSERNDR